MIISDSSPIIVLGKQGKLELLKNCFNKIIIPREVYNEIIVKNQSNEVISLNKAINEKWIIIEDVEINELIEDAKIEKGEKEAITLAHKYKSSLITDDESAKYYSSLFNLEAHGTLYVLLLSYKNKIIAKDKAKELLDNIIKEGFYVSDILYHTFINALESIRP